jgi:DNA polymerase III subunit epsilon
VYDLFDFLKKLLRLHSSHPALVKNQELFADFTQRKALGEYSFVVFDTELTGLNKRKDEIIAIGAVRILDLQIRPEQNFYRYIRPQNINPNKATLIHRITPEALEKAPSMEEVLPDFIEFCGDSLLVGHFVGLDMHFLNKALRATLRGILSNPSIDTMRLARRYTDNGTQDFFGNHDHASSYNLDHLAQEFHLPTFNPHDALEDALQTAYLFLYLVKKFQQGGVKTLKDLYSAGRIVGLRA